MIRVHNKFENELFNGEYLKVLNNPDVIKHFRTIKEAKAVGNLPLTSKEKPSIFSLNVLNDHHGDGILYSFGKLNDKGDGMDLDFFYRYDDPKKIEECFYQIFTVLEGATSNSIIYSFSETADVGLSLIKLMLDIDDGERYNKAEIRERFTRIEKKVNIKDEPIFEVFVGDYHIKLASRIGACTEFKIKKTKKKMKDITIKIYDLFPFFPKGIEKSYEKLNMKYPFQSVMKEIHFDKFTKEYNKKVSVQDYTKQNSKYVKDVYLKLRFENFATWNLGNALMNMFNETYGSYLTSAYSIGNITEQALSTELTKEQREKMTYGFFVNDLMENNETDDVLKALHFMTESYNAGKIEQNLHGYVETLAGGDLVSSYPYVMANGLYDLEGAKVEYFESGYYNNLEELKPKKGEYVLIRAYLTSDKEKGESHSILVKKDDVYTAEQLEEQLNNPTTIRKYDRKNVNPRGNFIVCETYEALKFFEDGKGNTINEIYEVVRIQTTGKKHPLSEVSQKWFNNRMKDKVNDFIKKITLNAVYGKTYEGYPLYEITKEKGAEKIEYVGQRVGSYFNPLLATIITSFARIRISEIERTAERNEAKVIQIQTDSIHFTLTDKKLNATQKEKELSKQLREAGNSFGRKLENNQMYKKYGMPEFYIGNNDLEIDEIIPERFESVLTENYGMVNGWTETKEFGMLTKPKIMKHGFFINIGVYEVEVDGVMEVKSMGFPLKDEDTTKKGFLTGYYRNRYFESVFNEKKLRGAGIEYYDGSYGFSIVYKEKNTIGSFLASDNMTYKHLGVEGSPTKFISLFGTMMNLTKRSLDTVSLEFNKIVFQRAVVFSLWAAEKFNEGGIQTNGLLDDYFELSSLTADDEIKITLNKFFANNSNFKQRQKIYSRLLGIEQRSKDETREDTVVKLRDKGCIELLIKENKINDLLNY